MLDQNLRITMYGKIATKSCPSASAPRNFAFRLTALLPLRRKSKNIDVIVARERGAAHACTHVLCFRFLSVCRSIDEGFLPHICFFFLSPLFFFVFPPRPQPQLQPPPATPRPPLKIAQGWREKPLSLSLSLSAALVWIQEQRVRRNLVR
ncbi:hypothetical protein IWX46DRAFT_187634 [Phyllosticta citricarpa]|uniref:Uncharacterized protein n=1 Tax=Phyllosticta citricarpa TaxID=55181 RepID=A0ABR1M1R0_9PEZI